MELKMIEGEFSICKVSDTSRICYDDSFVFVDTKDGETSVVCRTQYLPENCLECENGYRGLQARGKLDAFLLGCIAGMVKVLKEHDAHVFVTTTDTAEYVFVERRYFPKMVEGLKKAGYPVNE